MNLTDKQRIAALEAQVDSLIKDIQDADDLLSKGDNSGALVQVRVAASRASRSYLDCIGRAAARAA